MRPRPATKRPRGNGLGSLRLPPDWCETMRKNHHEKQIATENNNLKPLFLYLKNICIFVFFKAQTSSPTCRAIFIFCGASAPPKVRQNGAAKIFRIPGWETMSPFGAYEVSQPLRWDARRFDILPGAIVSPCRRHSQEKKHNISYTYN